MSKEITIISILFVVVLFRGYAQQETKHIRQGNNLYSDEKYNASEIEYRKALEQNSSSVKANYNLAGSLYKQNKYDEAGEIYNNLTSSNLSKEELAKYYYNLGNSYLMSKKFEESIEAYKSALRNNPADVETKYNLAYAQSLLNQQQQDKNQQQQNQNNQNQDQKDQDNQDKQQQENQDQQNKQDQQNQQQQGQMSKEDAERILQALQNNEKETQENLNKQKVQPAGIYIEKNW